jgi:hypothetical protein
VLVSHDRAVLEALTSPPRPAVDRHPGEERLEPGAQPVVAGRFDCDAEDARRGVDGEPHPRLGAGEKRFRDGGQLAVERRGKRGGVEPWRFDGRHA